MKGESALRAMNLGPVGVASNGCAQEESRLGTFGSAAAGGSGRGGAVRGAGVCRWSSTDGICEHKVLRVRRGCR